MPNLARGRANLSLTLEEARLIYRPRTADSRPLDNRRIRTQLRKSLRRRAELALAMSWNEISMIYRHYYLIEGTPDRGTATIVLDPDQLMRYIPREERRPQVRIGLYQRELFEKN